MEQGIEIAGADFIAFYNYRITYKGAPEEGPTYACGGQPAEPMEYEIGLVDLKDASSFRSLTVPGWLRSAIVNHLQEFGAVYEAIQADIS